MFRGILLRNQEEMVVVRRKIETNEGREFNINFVGHKQEDNPTARKNNNNTTGAGLVLSLMF